MTHSSAKYEKHLFICVNERAPGHPRKSCGSCGGKELRMKFLELIQEHDLKRKVRANKSLCIDACEFGPAVVIYPEGLWYIDVKESDVEEIFNTSILEDGVVERLVASPETWEKLRDIRSKEKKS